MSSIFRHIALVWTALIVALPMLIITNLSGATSSLTFLQELYLSKVNMQLDYFWTLYNFCRKNSEVVCTPNFAAYPYQPYLLSDRLNPNTSFYYILRAAYGLLLGGLVLTFLANFMAIVCVLWRKRTPYAFFRFLVWISYLSAACGAALNTAIHVAGVNSFQSIGYDAIVGVKMFIFMWLGVGFLFLACLFLCCSSAPIFPETYRNGRYNDPQPVPQMQYGPPGPMPQYQQYSQSFPPLDNYLYYPQPAQHNNH